jgi:hypothetical protein
LSRNVDRQAREQHCHSGNVPVVLARLVGAPQDHVIDFFDWKAGPLNQSADNSSGQVIGAELCQSSAQTTDRRPNGGGDEGVRHGADQKE